MKKYYSSPLVEVDKFSAAADSIITDSDPLVDVPDPRPEIPGEDFDF